MPLINPNPLKVSADPNGCCGIYQIDLISKFKTPQEVLRGLLGEEYRLVPYRI